MRVVFADDRIECDLNIPDRTQVTPATLVHSAARTIRELQSGPEEIFEALPGLDQLLRSDHRRRLSRGRASMIGSESRNGNASANSSRRRWIFNRSNLSG